jgi:hypothetical protein
MNWAMPQAPAGETASGFQPDSVWIWAAPSAAEIRPRWLDLEEFIDHAEYWRDAVEEFWWLTAGQVGGGRPDGGQGQQWAPPGAGPVAVR